MELVYSAEAGRSAAGGSLARAALGLVYTGVRMLHPGEKIPLDVGLPNPDPDWTWVLLHNGVIEAALLACPCHGIVQMVRLVSKAPPRLLSRLLRQVVRDCRLRGYAGYIVWLDQSRKEEQGLLRILRRGGAIVAPGLHICVGGDLERVGRY